MSGGEGDGAWAGRSGTCWAGGIRHRVVARGRGSKVKSCFLWFGLGFVLSGEQALSRFKW